MMPINRLRTLVLVAVVFSLAWFAKPSAAQNKPAPANPGLSETPAKFEPVTDSFDYVKRDVMIPMRDGVKLHTVILVPKGREGRADAPDADSV